jgi:hypothetical protein
MKIKILFVDLFIVAFKLPEYCKYEFDMHLTIKEKSHLLEITLTTIILEH